MKWIIKSACNQFNFKNVSQSIEFLVWSWMKFVDGREKLSAYRKVLEKFSQFRISLKYWNLINKVALHVRRTLLKSKVNNITSLCRRSSTNDVVILCRAWKTSSLQGHIYHQANNFIKKIINWISTNFSWIIWGLFYELISNSTYNMC